MVRKHFFFLKAGRFSRQQTGSQPVGASQMDWGGATSLLEERLLDAPGDWLVRLELIATELAGLF